MAMLTVTQSDFTTLCHHCERAYPQEGCGILLGTREGCDRHVRVIIQCRNERTAEPRTSYAIDPHVLIYAQRDAREGGLEIVGFYHSHPDHPAEYSPRDLEEAHWDGCSYLIISVKSGVAVESRSFILEQDVPGKHFNEEQVRIEPQ